MQNLSTGICKGLQRSWSLWCHTQGTSNVTWLCADHFLSKCTFAPLTPMTNEADILISGQWDNNHIYPIAKARNLTLKCAVRGETRDGCDSCCASTLRNYKYMLQRRQRWSGKESITFVRWPKFIKPFQLGDMQHLTENVPSRLSHFQNVYDVQSINVI